MDRIIVRYKPHGTKVSIRPINFDSKVHERLDRASEKEPVKDLVKGPITVRDEVTQQDCTQEELEAMWQQYKEKYGTMPIGRWRVDVKWLKHKLAA